MRILIFIAIFRFQKIPHYIRNYNLWYVVAALISVSLSMLLTPATVSHSEQREESLNNFQIKNLC